MTIGYTAVERFEPESGGLFGSSRSSGLHPIVDVVTLDCLLCPNVLDGLIDEDWEHNLTDIDKPFWFRDLDYLLARVADAADYQVLAVAKNPTEPLTLDDPRFEFIGYDLVEKRPGAISAITNCGGSDNAFHADELSFHGLIPTFDDAVRINALLIQNNPDEPHACCDMIAVWRMVTAPTHL
ncbi:MAG: hypothetical protein JWQ02_945 [Capsulimonas sp.]|nr:hypothetical protein [Capsulimonas sp.]